MTGPCQCRNGVYIEKVYTLGGIQFDDSYCGICSKPWRRPKPSNAPSLVAAAQDSKGTSTTPEEAPLREIGRAAFGLRYPEDAA